MRSRFLFLCQLILALIGGALMCCGCPEGGSSNNEGPQFRSYFVYTANTGSNDISMFQANKEGKLQFLGKVAAGGAPLDIVYDSWVFVANSTASTIGVYTVGSDGRLTLTATVPTGSTPTHLSVSKSAPDQDDHLLVSCAGSNEVILYHIGRGTGTLTEKHRFSVAGPGRATENINVYIPSNTDNKLYQFKQTLTGWVPGTPDSLATGDAPSVAYNSYLGSAVYVLNFFGDSVSVYDISLQGDNPRFESVGSLSSGSNPVAISGDFDSNPQNVYVVNRGIETISHYTVDTSTGFLTPAGGSTPSAGTLPSGIVMASNGLRDLRVFAYVTTSGGALRLYQQQADDSLAFLESFDTDGSNVNAVCATGFMNSVPLVITTTSLPGGTFGSPYSAELQVQGGVADKRAHFTVTSGQLPPGLHFDEAAPEEEDRYTRLVGTPTQHGTFTFSLSASQPGIGSSAVTYTVVIAPSGGGGGGDKARFMNCSPDGGNGTLKIDDTFTVGSNVPYPTMSNSVDISSLTDGDFHIFNFTTVGGIEGSGSSTLVDGNSYMLFGLGTHSIGEFGVGRRVLASNYTVPAGKVLITLVDGMPSFPMDFYVLQGSDTPNGSNKTITLEFGQTLKLQPERTAGSYRIFATAEGNPSSIIAQTSLISIPAGSIVDFVLTAPPGQSGAFVTAFEN